MLWSDISNELDIPERTVNKIIDTDIAEVCRESDLIIDIIKDATEASQIMGKINLHIANDINSRIKNPDREWDRPYPSSDEIRTLNTTVDSAFKRSQLLTWKPTDIFKHEWLSTEQAEKIAKLYNGNT